MKSVKTVPQEPPAASDDPPLGFAELSAGKLLAKNSIWNLVGLGLPLVAALIALPHLVTGLGTTRLGILAITWTVVGYFSLFDFGIGRALTTLIAEELGAGRRERSAGLAWTGLCLMVALGLVGTLLVFVGTPFLLTRVLKVPEELYQESYKAFLVLAATIPFVISAAGLRGILEAYQRFDLVNAVRIPLGLLNFLGPLAMLPFSNSLFAMVMVLAVGRVLAWAASAVLSARVMPELWRGVCFRRESVAPLVRLGGWMTVTNTVGPVIVYIDRFLIAYFVSATAVAFYVTPFEVVGKLLIVTSAIASVLFTAFAASFQNDRALTARRYQQGLGATAALLFPACLAFVILAPMGIRLWIDADFAMESGTVAQLLAIGVFANAMGQIPFTLVQAVGRPDLSAKLHVIELPLYILLVWGLASRHGVNGAALAMAIRSLIDTLILMLIARKLVPEIGGASWRWMGGTLLATGLLVAVFFVPGMVAL